MDGKESKEMYLKTILKMEEKNEQIRSIDIARELGYTKPSISKALKVLSDLGYIEHSPYSSIILTDTGREIALKVRQSNKIICEFFVTSLGLSPETAEKEACDMEHRISQETLDAMKEFIKKHKK